MVCLLELLLPLLLFPLNFFFMVFHKRRICVDPMVDSCSLFEEPASYWDATSGQVIRETRRVGDVRLTQAGEKDLCHYLLAGSGTDQQGVMM